MALPPTRTPDHSGDLIHLDQLPRFGEWRALKGPLNLFSAALLENLRGDSTKNLRFTSFFPTLASADLPHAHGHRSFIGVAALNLRGKSKSWAVFPPFIRLMFSEGLPTITPTLCCILT